MDVEMEEKSVEQIFLNPGLLLDKAHPEFGVDHEVKLNAINQHLIQITESIQNKKLMATEPKFIGSHPVSMTKKWLDNDVLNKKDVLERRTNWSEQQQKWLVCEKSDGIRFLLFVMNNAECFLNGRNVGGIKKERQLQFFHCNISLPRNFQQIKETEYNTNLRIMYIFDGELVCDRYLINGKETKHFKFLIFDTIYHQSIEERVFARPYKERLELGLQFVKFRKESKMLYRRMREEAVKQNKIRLAMKDFYNVSQVEYILKTVIPMIPHGNDGLIFTKDIAPYKIGMNFDILKFKPPHLNTIDFLLLPNENFNSQSALNGRLHQRVVDLYVLNKEDKIMFDFMSVTPEFYQELTNTYNILLEEVTDYAVNGVIAELSYEITSENQAVRVILENFKDKVQSLQSSELKQASPVFNNILQQCSYSQDNTTNSAELKDFAENLNNFDKRGRVGNWKFHKYRFDKSEPNAHFTASQVMKTIAENLLYQNVIEEIQNLNQDEAQRLKTQGSAKQIQNQNIRHPNPNSQHKGPVLKKWVKQNDN